MEGQHTRQQRWTVRHVLYIGLGGLVVAVSVEDLAERERGIGKCVFSSSRSDRKFPKKRLGQRESENGSRRLI